MYYPYFRGKQNELITIRENAALLKEANFTPIVEPVKRSINGLKRTLDAVIEAEGKIIVIVNPCYGDFKGDLEDLSTLIETEYAESDHIKVGILLSENTTVQQVLDLYGRHNTHQVVLVHSGFSKGQDLSESLNEVDVKVQHVFIEEHCGKLYRRHFPGENRILIRDGFVRKNNRDYPPLEFFSDLHVTFEEEGVSGFGDFLITGDEFRESGGPAYAIAIHLTFIDSLRDDEMHIHHFVSIRQDTPTDPAGKFSEALKKLVEEADKRESYILDTRAVSEFRELHRRQHYPGLGYVKKLSMQHHIETLAQYFRGLR
ncbi:sce7725 family protein [Paremcibacter congregatus]|uniref:sce7725 family protein n=1 Tax=Paremcibacter congregatus TaxID=2043170 RepID=UPI0030ECC65E|tara:strand:- start:4859 stop:5803 length:945 start_codon:yes stop_codon:yes gene_type:complete